MSSDTKELDKNFHAKRHTLFIHQHTMSWFFQEYLPFFSLPIQSLIALHLAQTYKTL